MRIVTLVALAGLTACGVQTREARAIQPNPATALRSTEELPASVPLSIFRKDSRLGLSYQLRDSAQFVVVDKNRLRFRVSIVEREESDADTAGVKVWLVDAAGRRYDFENRENGRMSRIAANVRPLPYRPAGNRCSPPPCFEILGPNDAFEVYQGQADYVFRSDGIAEHAQGFTLFVEHLGIADNFTWKFGDGQEVQNYGRTQSDILYGVVELPGPQTQVVATKAEGDHW